MDRHSRLRLTALLTALGVVIGGFGVTLGWSAGLQHQAEDLLQPGTDGSEEVVVVAIDRGTLAAVGESWPWPRSLHANLIRAIAAAGPSVIAYDVLFADSRDDDPVLVSAMGDAPVVLASALTLRRAPGPAQVVDEVGPTASLARSSAGVGHANVTLSADQGVVRSIPLYALDDRGIVKPSLALAALAVTENTSQFLERPQGIQVGDRLIPLDDGELRVNYAGAFSGADAAVVSAGDILTGNVDDDVLTSKIVVVGVTEPTLGDLHLIPTDKSGSTSGLVIHANALNTVLNRAYLDNAATSGQVLAVVFVSIVSAVAFTWARLRFAWAMSAALIALMVAWTTWRFHAAGELWNVVWPTLAVAVVAASGSGARYHNEIRHRRRAASVFEQYVPAGTLDELVDPAAFERATRGERLDIATLFCDLRGFTPIAATLDPPQVRAMLDHYYEYVVSRVRLQDGTVLQFVGDEVFAVFGAPIPRPDDARRAAACALSLVNDVKKLYATLAAEGLPTITFGIGLHHGPALAAHVGSVDFRQYSVFGDTVNIGSRLCDLADPGQIVASEDIIAEVDGLATEVLGTLPMKGVERPIVAHRLVALQVRPPMT